jgi:hypothetical protein
MSRMFVEIMRDMLVMMVLVVLTMAMVKRTRRFDIPLHIIICILWHNLHFITLLPNTICIPLRHYKFLWYPILYIKATVVSVCLW